MNGQREQRLDTTISDIAHRVGETLAEILGGTYSIKALGHHVEVYSTRGTAIVDLYPRGRYILMRLNGPNEAIKLVDFRPMKFRDGTTRYLIYIPNTKLQEPQGFRHHRLYVYGYVKLRNAFYLVGAHRSHIELAEESIEKYIEGLNDDALLYGNFDTSGRSPSFIVRKLDPHSSLVMEAEKRLGIKPSGCLEASGAGTVSAIIMAYAHAKKLGRSWNAVLQSIVEISKKRKPKKRFLCSCSLAGPRAACI